MPNSSPLTEATSLNMEELEAVRLVDLLELEQEVAAFYMGISRKAFWNDLTSARRKIATALVYGMGIRIEGASYVLRDPLVRGCKERGSSNLEGCRTLSSGEGAGALEHQVGSSQGADGVSQGQ